MDEVEERNKIREDKRTFIREIVGHSLAIILVVGFFIIILTALLGFVDIKDPSVTAFVGTSLGYAAAKIEPVVYRYFNVDIKKDIEKENTQDNEQKV